MGLCVIWAGACRTGRILKLGRTEKYIPAKGIQ